jgi:6-phospho-beta-glucosidase
LKDSGGVPGLDISPDLISAIKMIPNEYLYYYYHSRKAVQNIISAGVTRGEQLSSLNDALYAKLRMLVENDDMDSIRKTYVDYIQNRISSYMENETRRTSPDLKKISQSIDIGYAEIALDLIESITTGISKSLILNIPNHGAISGMQPTDVVEIPVVVHGNTLQRTQIGEVPDHCLGLMKQVKSYEKLTIEAAIERSYEKALTALSIHPLIEDYDIARKILDGYLSHHGSYFPVLS